MYLLRSFVGTLLLVSCSAMADPWAAPGDIVLRDDIARLSDAGIIRSPVTTWPIPWATVARDLDAAGDPTTWASGLRQSFDRVSRRIANVRRSRGFQPGVKTSVSTDNFWLRTFEDTPREGGEVRAGASWMGNRFALRVQGSYIVDADDDQDWRMDGSYASVILGNHILSAGAVDRWWGPGWDNSLIMSSNARPVAGFTAERNVSLPFETRWLSWIGPWTYSLVWGFLGDDRVIDNARVLAFRGAFRPVNDVELGVSRAATWCGSGQSCDPDVLWDIVIGDDNSGSPEDDPSNQLFSFDARWNSPIGDAPYALYTQWIANDEVSGLPSEWAFQAGAEHWGEMNRWMLKGAYRIRLEVSETIPEFWESAPAYNRLYDHFLYRSGYRYKFRSMGAAMDGDSIMASLGGTLIEDDGGAWSAQLRYTKVNKNGDGEGVDRFHSVSTTEVDFWNAGMSYKRPVSFRNWDLGNISLGAGVQYEDDSVTDDKSTDFQGFVQWSWDASGL